MTSKGLTEDYPTRILMLVPHEPHLDPRVDWVIKLCAEIGRTDVLGFVVETQKPLREYDQTIYLERVFTHHYPLPWMIWLADKVIPLLHPRVLLSYVYYLIHHVAYLLVTSLPGGQELKTKVRSVKESIRKKSEENTALASSLAQEMSSIPSIAVGSSKTEEKSDSPLKTNYSCTEAPVKKPSQVIRTIWDVFYAQKIISNALFQRAKASSIVPKVIICHDLQALEAGVRLKEKFKSRLLYDSHELWIEADLAGTDLERRLIKSREQRLIKHADAVITVTPQIADCLEKMYGIHNVLTVPNAEPFVTPSHEDTPVSLPVEFLLQGRAVPGRGIEEFLEIWEQLDDSRALLILRSTTTPFLDCLKRRFNHSINQGRIVIAKPVMESDLIRAARSSDVGIIPYPGPNLNHIYACPNKLSQYMQAGLAILHNSDEQFVTEIVNRYSCGVSYNVSSPASLLNMVRNLLDNPERIREMKRNAYRAAQTEFNWEVKSKVYSQAIKRLFEN